jgi:hypothetical protein
MVDGRFHFLALPRVTKSNLTIRDAESGHAGAIRVAPRSSYRCMRGNCAGSWREPPSGEDSMTNQWFYGRGANVSGPVSSQELIDLAASGDVVPTDTIWRDNIEAGVPAAKVKNLFSPAISSTAAAPADAPDVPSAPTEGSPETPTPAAALVPSPVQPARPARATAGAGAVVLSQDGKNVKFRGKCSTCGREDTSWKSMAIPRGTMRASFFCGKCRKRRDIEIHGYH